MRAERRYQAERPAERKRRGVMGRPRKFEGEQARIALRMPAALRRELERESARTGESLSDVVLRWLTA